MCRNLLWVWERVRWWDDLLRSTHPPVFTLLWDVVRLLQNIWTCYCCSLALSQFSSRSHHPLLGRDSILLIVRLGDYFEIFICWFKTHIQKQRMCIVIVVLILYAICAALKCILFTYTASRQQMHAKTVCTEKLLELTQASRIGKFFEWLLEFSDLIEQFYRCLRSNGNHTS